MPGHFSSESSCILRRHLFPQRNIARNEQCYGVGHGLVEMRLSIKEVVLSGVQMQVHRDPPLAPASRKIAWFRGGVPVYQPCHER
jgi:hypothetical protein